MSSVRVLYYVQSMVKFWALKHIPRRNIYRDDNAIVLYIWENECCMFVQMVILTRVYELTVHSALRQLVGLSG